MNIKRKIKRVFTLLLFTFSIVFFTGGIVYADEVTSDSKLLMENDSLTMEFDYKSNESYNKSVIVDGKKLSLKAEPVNSYIPYGLRSARGVVGTWKISGSNSLASMEYYIEVIEKNGYGYISDAWGLAILGKLTSFENEKINIVRRQETRTKYAIAEGYAKFNYLGNQWVSVWTQTGGVRAKVGNGKVTQSLYWLIGVHLWN